MKKALLSIWIILIALTGMASANPKTEKLIFDDNNWNYDPLTNQLQIPLRCDFGIATAGEECSGYH